MKRRLAVILITGSVAILVIGIFAGQVILRWLKTEITRGPRLVDWFQHSADHPDWEIRAGECCGAAPFLMPTTGYIGFLWDDSFKLGNRHQGLDIFGPQQPGVTPVVAAYPGYLTRRADWKSTVAIRIPSDPFQPGRQIWLYYTHMASADGQSFIAESFPPGTLDVYVKAGTLLGYQGNFSGSPDNHTGIHLHFSIVLDEGVDTEHPTGSLRNELDIRNTLDPSAYLGLEVNANVNRGQIPVCTTQPVPAIEIGLP